MRNLLKKNKKKNLIVKTFLIILLLVHTDFFLNSYLILLKDYHSRMENGYGYCDKQGYGFIQKYNKWIETKMKVHKHWKNYVFFQMIQS